LIVLSLLCSTLFVVVFAMVRVRLDKLGPVTFGVVTFALIVHPTVILTNIVIIVVVLPGKITLLLLLLFTT